MGFLGAPRIEHPTKRDDFLLKEMGGKDTGPARGCIVARRIRHFLARRPGVTCLGATGRCQRKI